MAVLVQLIEHAGEPVSRDHLMATVWAGTVVGDEALTRCVSELRSAFGDSANRPDYIQTIPKTGYQLVMPVTVLDVHRATKRWSLAGVVVILAFVAVAAVVVFEADDGPPSVAILPFDSLTDDVETNHFGAGLAEEILHALINVQGLNVASRHASFQVDLKLPVSEIAQSLAVDHVLTGTVRKVADTIRVAVQLVDVRSGFHVWSKSYEGQAEELFEIQDDIALAVADTLKVDLSAPLSVARVTRNVDELDLYLLGRYHWHKRTAESLEKAIGFFQQALSIDPAVRSGAQWARGCPDVAGWLRRARQVRSHRARGAVGRSRACAGPEPRPQPGVARHADADAPRPVDRRACVPARNRA